MLIIGVILQLEQRKGTKREKETSNGVPKHPGSKIIYDQRNKVTINRFRKRRDDLC